MLWIAGVDAKFVSTEKLDSASKAALEVFVELI